MSLKLCNQDQPRLGSLIQNQSTQLDQDNLRKAEMLSAPVPADRNIFFKGGVQIWNKGHVIAKSDW
jgi:uncharacterized protein GlcG (DUF336 family)